MRYAILAFSLLFGTMIPASAGAAVGVSISGVSIRVHLSVYPDLVPVPGYPVYYAPQVRANYFFYDGYYWLYHDDRWYVSDWYDGPWDQVAPDDVPLFVLRVPVRYYVAAPAYFRVWYIDAPPRWHLHWGHRWTRHYHGWERWDHVVQAAPLAHYQRHYAGPDYPRGEYRHRIRHEHYQYRPHDPAVRQHDEARTRESPRERKPESEPNQQTLRFRQAVPPHNGLPTPPQSPSLPLAQRAQSAPGQPGAARQRPLRADSAPQQRDPDTRSGKPPDRRTEQQPQVRESSVSERNDARVGRSQRGRDPGTMSAGAQERGSRRQ